MNNLSISNIGWATDSDNAVYGLMKDLGFAGLEIAPTRIFPTDPYGHLEEAKDWYLKLAADHGFSVPSMQSIWYGRTERLFGSEEDRGILLDYTRKAIDFAVAINCRNLVFGCPKNRRIPAGADEHLAISFFKEVGAYATAHGTVVGLEANPPIYDTNYINTTSEALELIERVDSDGIKLNLDMGTMIENGEDPSVLKGYEHAINHVHISEPYLVPIKNRKIHVELAELLRKCNYNGFVSIEVGKQDNLRDIEEMMKYVKGIFGEAR